MGTSTRRAGLSGDDGRRVTRWDGVSAVTLSEALAPPAVQCIEADLAIRNVRLLTVRKSPECLSLTVTTRSAYKTFINRVFTNAIADRMHCSSDLRERVSTAVQEALMNAVLHGSLQIEPHLRNDFQSLLIVHEQIEAQLALERVAHSMIRVQALWSSTSLHILIRDEGEGIQAANPPPAQQDTGEERASGRGLLVLASMCDRFALIEGGRTAKMSFAR